MRAFHNLSTALICLTLFFISCYTYISPIDLTDKTHIPNSEGIVFGKLKLIDKGKQVEIVNETGISNLRVSVLHNESKHGFIYYSFKQDGYFYWHLPSGNYTIVSLLWGNRRARILAYFTISKEYTTYVGTLKTNLKGSIYTKYIEDEFDRAILDFKKRFPSIRKEIIKNLMVLERDK